MAQDTRWFNPKGGDYFHMNDRGRFTRKQHNPNNVHIGEGYGGGPLSIGNPRNDTMQLAELTQKQKNYMGKVEHTPAFGIPKKDLYDKVKDMENKKWDFEWGVQEPTPPQEFNDYYNQLGQGEVGNWQLAMNRGLDNWGGGNPTYDGTFRQEGYGDPNITTNKWGGHYPIDYNYDPYDDDVLDPGFGDHAIGPLYFG